MSQCETIESRDNLASPRAIRISRTRSRRRQTRARRSAERQRSCRMKTACCSTRPSEASPSTHCWPSTSACPSTWVFVSTPRPHGGACAQWSRITWICGTLVCLTQSNTPAGQEVLINLLIVEMLCQFCFST